MMKLIEALKTAGSVLYVLAWFLVWMLLLNKGYFYTQSLFFLIVGNLFYGFATWGSMWAVNHDSFHQLSVQHLPAINRHGKMEHHLHHRDPSDATHLFVPLDVWARLLMLTLCISGISTLLQVPAVESNWRLLIVLVSCWLGMLGFMELYRLVHDRAHTDPMAPQRWWFPHSHVVRHHTNQKTSPGLYPVFEGLLPGLRCYALILRLLRRWEDWRKPSIV